jgi:hypothetical protein
MVFVKYTNDSHFEELVAFGNTWEQAFQYLKELADDVNISIQDCEFYKGEKIFVKMLVSSR